MTLADLEARLDTIVEVSLDIWAMAEILINPRILSNSVRLSESERDDPEKIEIFGVVSELILRQILLELPDSVAAVQNLEGALFLPGGGSDPRAQEPDLNVYDGQRFVGIDAKSHNTESHRRYYAISNKKHENIRGKCAGYFCVIVPRNGKRAAVAKLVPYADVERWECFPLGRTPSRNLLLDHFRTRYCPKFQMGSLRSDLHDEKEVKARARDGELRESLLSFVPALSTYLPPQKDS